jgi:hypothetical protein
MRVLAAEEEEKLNGTLNYFVGAVNDLKEVTRQIDEYTPEERRLVRKRLETDASQRLKFPRM